MTDETKPARRWDLAECGAPLTSQSVWQCSVHGFAPCVEEGWDADLESVLAVALVRATKVPGGGARYAWDYATGAEFAKALMPILREELRR